MKLRIRNIVLPAVLTLSVGLTTVQKIQGQSLHDSLKQILTQLDAHAKSTGLKNTIKDAAVFYSGNSINDSLSKRLLTIDSLLINTAELNQPKTSAYVETLLKLFEDLPPRGAHPDYADCLHYAAVFYRITGQYDKSMFYFQQALAIMRKVLGEAHPKYAIGLYHLSVLYYDMGQYEKVLPLDQQALAIIGKTLGEKDPTYAEVLLRIGTVYSRTGQYEKALPLYQQSLNIIKKILGKDNPRYALVLHNLGILYYRIGQYEQAQLSYEQSLAIYKKTIGEGDPEYAANLNNLANLYTKTGQYEKALPLYEQAMPIFHKAFGEKHFRYASCLTYLADLYFAMSQYEKVLPLYERSLAIYREVLGDKNPLYALCLSNMANVYFAMRDYKAALPLYERSLAAYKQSLGEEHPEYVQNLNYLALVYIPLGNLSRTAALLIEASNRTLKNLSQTYATLSEQEKMNFLTNKSFRFNYIPSLLFTHIQSPSTVIRQLYVSELALKGMVLEDQKGVLSRIRKSGDSTALQLYEQWRHTKIVLGKQLLLPYAKRVPYLDSLQEVANQLEQQLSRRAASFRSLQQIQSITINDISQKLLKGEAAIEFIRFNLYNKKWTDSTMYAALVLLPGDSLVRFVSLFEEKQLQHILKPSLSDKSMYAQYTAIERLYDKDFMRTSGAMPSSLYKLIWKPLEGHLAGVHTIYYAPAGLLHRIAFSAIPADASHLLIDKYRLRQVLSTRSAALPAAVAQKPRSVSLWGNIRYNTQLASLPDDHLSIQQPSGDTAVSSFNFYTPDTRAARGGDWRSLPGAKREMDSLATLFTNAGITTTVDSETVATEEAFKALSGRSPQVVHVATHGFFLPVAENKPKNNTASNVSGGAFTLQQNPMFRSGLILAGGNSVWKGASAVPGREDGILTAYEIAQMDLSGTDVVVLSACETALGDVQGNEGVIGLQRAFKMAGVKQLVMSLWRVPDVQTMELMTLFYRNWLSGQSTREALRMAQLKMKEKYPPYYWAAFVLVE